MPLEGRRLRAVISMDKLVQYTETVSTREMLPWRKLVDTQGFIRELTAWGARCRKAARRVLLGACLARDTSTNQIRKSGSVRVTPRKGRIYSTT